MIKRIWYNNYYDGDTREICHEIKNRNEECYEIMVHFFLNQEVINNKSILIPAPQHEGYAIYTKKIAEMIAVESGAKVLDVLKSSPRKTLYKSKQNHQKTILDFKITEELFLNNKKIFLIDNVLHTGQTLYTCQKLINYPLIPLVYGILK